jgi:fluoroacetyl-CoA thioesterase
MSVRLTDIPIGTTTTRAVVVTREMTVGHFHPGYPEVLGTPFMIYHLEVTASEALAPYLPEGWLTVGTLVHVEHLAATPVGFTVTFTARVTETAERSVTFELEAHDGVELVSRGTHTRAPIELARFEKGLARKRGAPPRPPAP